MISALNVKVNEIQTKREERWLRTTSCAESALNVKVMEIETSADPAVLWLRARQLCYLGGHAPQSGEIIEPHPSPPKSKDDMPADLADTLKADEEDRKTDRAPLVAVTENEEVATDDGDGR